MLRGQIATCFTTHVKRWNKNIFRHTKAESIHHQQTGITRNVNRSPSVTRKMIPDGSLDIRQIDEKQG